MDDKITIVGDLFPAVNHEKIGKALESADGDVNVACAMLLSEQEALEKLKDLEVTQNSSCLVENSPTEANQDHIERSPLSSKEDVEAWIQNFNSGNNSNITPTVNQSKNTYNNYDDGRDANNKPRRIQQVDLKTKLRKPVQSFVKPKKNSLNMQEPSCGSEIWSSSENAVNTIVKYTEVPEGLARNAYYLNSFDSTRAIIDVICHYDKYTEKYGLHNFERESEPDKLTERLVAGLGGKVQTGKGIAHSKGRREPNEENDASLPRELSRIRQPSNYVYHRDSPESRELEAFIASNRGLRDISQEFLKTALIFYEGDVIKTIMLAEVIIQNRCANYTYFKPSSSPTYSDEPKVTTKSPQALILTAVAKNDDGGKISRQMFSTDENYRKATDALRSVLSISAIDLHGFFPDEAVLIARGCLELWWDEELISRERSKQRINQIKVINVQPFKITTGRGLHSVGGISKVRKRIQAFLDANCYVYIEEPSFFIVEGRRRFHRI